MHELLWLLSCSQGSGFLRLGNPTAMAARGRICWQKRNCYGFKQSG